MRVQSAVYPPIGDAPAELLSHRWVVQVSDRMLTFYDASGRPDVYEDEHNKAVVYCSRAVTQFTGVAELEVDGEAIRTDHWIAQQLIGRPLDDALNALPLTAAALFAGPRLRGRKLEMVTTGWARTPVGLQPFLRTTSNFDRRTGSLHDGSGARFAIEDGVLEPNELFRLHIAGAALPRQRRRALERTLADIGRRHLSIDNVVRLLVDAVRSVAESNPSVGKSLMRSTLPRAGVRPDGDAKLVMGRHNDAPSFLHFPASTDDPTQYAPLFVCLAGEYLANITHRPLRGPAAPVDPDDSMTQR